MDESKEFNKKFSWIDGIKSKLKNIEPKAKIKFIIMIVFVAMLIVIYNNYFGSGENKDVASSQDEYTYYVSSIDYCNEMESKLKKVLSNIDGVGNVEVMITLETSMELVFANGYDSKNNSIFTSNDSDKVEVMSPIIIETDGNQKPIIVKEILPKIKGVLVVCSGVENVTKRLDIIYAVKSLLNIDVSNIQVLSKS